MKKFIQRLKKDERGLTLVELLAVIVILAIVGGIAFVAVGNIIENSKMDAHVANAQQLLSAAKLYEASAGEFPTGGLTNDSSVYTEATEMDTIGVLNDPWEGEGDYAGLVEKSGDQYLVTIQGGSADCTLEDVEEAVINTGRDACGG